MRLSDFNLSMVNQEAAIVLGIPKTMSTLKADARSRVHGMCGGGMNCSGGGGQCGGGMNCGGGGGRCGGGMNCSGGGGQCGGGMNCGGQ